MPRQSAAPATSTVKISPRGASRLKRGHVWVYRSDIASADSILPGSLVSVSDERNRFLGTAFYSSASQIAIRMLSPKPINDLPAFLRNRIAAALAHRHKVVRDSDAYRLVFSEADFLPGLIVDRYNDIVSLQVLTQAMDSEIARQTIVSELSERVNPAAIAERVDPRVRQLEQLPPRVSGLIHGEKTNTIIT